MKLIIINFQSNTCILKVFVLLFFRGGNEMKSTGIVRKIDELGRVVLPMELRKTLNIQIKDPMEIYVEGDSVILRKYEPCCIFCGDSTNVSYFKDKVVCESCKKELSK